MIDFKCLMMAIVIAASIFESSHAQAKEFYGLVIGVTNYKLALKGPKPYELDKAAKDVKLALNSLAKKSGFKQENTHIKLLLDSNLNEFDKPKSYSITRNIQNIHRKIDKEDTFVFFFTGHGENTHIYTSGAGENFSDTQVEIIKIRKLIEKIPAKTKIVFLDVCRTGASGYTKGNVEFDAREITNIEEKSGQAWFNSSSERQYSWVDRELNYGIFTKHLIDAFRNDASDGWTLKGEIATNKDGVVEASELGAFLRVRVKEDARRQYGVDQEPDDNAPGGMVLYRINADVVGKTVPESVSVPQLQSAQTRQTFEIISNDKLTREPARRKFFEACIRYSRNTDNEAIRSEMNKKLAEVYGIYRKLSLCIDSKQCAPIDPDVYKDFCSGMVGEDSFLNSIVKCQARLRSARINLRNWPHFLNVYDPEAERRGYIEKIAAYCAPTPPTRSIRFTPDQTNRQLKEFERNTVDDQNKIKRLPIVDIQKKLTFLGCAPGPVDGVWGKQSKTALRRFLRLAKSDLSHVAPSRKILNLLRIHSKGFCRTEQSAKQTSPRKSSKPSNQKYKVVKRELNTKYSPYRYKHCKNSFRSWVFNYSNKSYAAFAFGRDGCGFSMNMSSLTAAKTAAMSNCRKHSGDCVIYQVVTRE